MNKYLAVFGVLCGLLVGSVFAQTTKSGTIAASETWSGTVTVTGKVTITGGTVTISPGAVISVADSMGIYVQKGGALQAVGTALNPIRFTSNSASPTAGKWDRIALDSNGTKSRFSYCVIEYAGDGINLNNSSPTISYCTIQSVGCGIFGKGGSGCNPTIDHCTFRSCGISIFFDTAGTISITYTYMFNTSCGIILAGGGAENVTVNHCTISLIDMRLAQGLWWTGYGIFCCNTAARLTLTNTIVSFGTVATTYTQYGLKKDSPWTVTRDYNCWFGGKGAIQNEALGTHDKNVDPVFVNFSGGDMRLRSTSTCLNAGSDGTHLGAWQGTPTVDVVMFKGRVTDSQTAAGVAQALVLVKGTTNQTATDNSGYFTLYEVPSGIAPAGYDNLEARPGIFFDQAHGLIKVQSGGRAAVTLYDAAGRPVALEQRANNWQLLPRTTGMYVVETVLGDQTYYAKALAVNGSWRLEEFGYNTAMGPAAKAAATATLVCSKSGYDLKEQVATVGDQNVAISIVDNGTGGYLYSDFRDTMLSGSYVDNYSWLASTWEGTGGNLFTLANLRLATKDLTDPNGTGYIYMKVPASKMEGAEIVYGQDTYYGYYEVRMKCSNVWGSCNAFFWINQGTGEEIDCEFLTPDFHDQPANVGKIHCMLHPNGGGEHIDLSVNPSTGFHRYGLLWRAGLLQWTCDGAVIYTVNNASQVPRNPGKMFFNNWTGGYNWGDGPPTFDNIMVVDWMRFHPGATSIVAVPAHLQR